MQLYGRGRLVHQLRSDEGVIEVVDEGDSRSLHFGTYPRQSSMRISDPVTLELSLYPGNDELLVVEPRTGESFWLLVLGGGSLVKFLLHHYVKCVIDVVEYRQDVIDVAQRYFHVPADDQRLTIHLGDGYLFVKKCFDETDNQYDLLLVDAYDHNGMAMTVGIQSFFDACAGILTDNGVLSMNLWGSERGQFNEVMQRINQSFAQQALILPVENKGNVIALATRFYVKNADLKRLRPYAEQLEMRLRINLPKSLQNLIRQNRNFIHRLFAM